MENKEAIKDTVTEEKVINVVDFKEVRDKKGQPMNLEEYMKRPDTTVKRGELIEILTQVMGNIDNELIDSFQRVVRTANLVEIVVEALIANGLISMDDISKAQKVMVEKLEQMQKEVEANGEGQEN